MKKILIFLFISFAAQLYASELDFKNNLQLYINSRINCNDIKAFEILNKIFSDSSQHLASSILLNEVVKSSNNLDIELVNSLLNTYKNTLSHRDLAYNTAVSKIGLTENRDLIYDIIKPIRFWKVSEPYFQDGQADDEYVFEPEYNLQSLNNARRTILQNGSIELSLEDLVYPLKGTVYIATSLLTEIPINVRIRAQEPYRLFVNGRLILINEGEKFSFFKIVRLSGADNINLLIKTAASSKQRISANITDDNGNLVEPRYTDQLVNYPILWDEVFEKQYEFLHNKITVSNDSNEKALWCALLGYYQEGIITNPTGFLKAYKETGNEKYKLLYIYSNLKSNEKESRNLFIDFSQTCSDETKNYPLYRYMELVLLGKNLNKDEYSQTIKNLSGTLDKSIEAAMFFLETYDELKYDKEFIDLYTKYSESLKRVGDIKAAMVKFYSSRDLNVFAQKAHEYLSHRNDLVLTRMLLDYYKQAELNEEAISFINKYNLEEIYRLEYGEFLMAADRNEEARNVFLSGIANTANPEFYKKMAELESKEGEDPFLYIMKYESIKKENSLD